MIMGSLSSPKTPNSSSSSWRRASLIYSSLLVKPTSQWFFSKFRSQFSSTITSSSSSSEEEELRKRSLDSCSSPPVHSPLSCSGKKVSKRIGRAGESSVVNVIVEDEINFRELQRKKSGDQLGIGVFKVSKVWRKILLTSNKFKSIILLNVLTVIYASDIPVLKEVEGFVDPALFSVIRFTTTALPFLPFIFLARQDSKVWTAGIELGLWVSLGYLTQAVGLVTSDAGRSSFISSFTVIVVPLMDGLLGARIPFLTWFGAAVSLVGIGFLESSGSPPSVGDLLNFLSAVFFGIHMLRTEHHSRNTKKECHLSLLGFEVWVVALSSAAWYFVNSGSSNSGPIGLLSGPGAWDNLVHFPWVPALYTGVFSTGVCLWAEITAMRNVSATETAVIYGLEPLWGAAFAWFLLDERWGLVGWLGAVLVLCGSLTVQLFGSGPENPKENEVRDYQLKEIRCLERETEVFGLKIKTDLRKKN